MNIWEWLDNKHEIYLREKQLSKYRYHQPEESNTVLKIGVVACIALLTYKVLEDKKQKEINNE